MSKRLVVTPAKLKQVDRPKGEFSYPLTLHRPPQQPGDSWVEVMINSPAELRQELEKTSRSSGQKKP